MQDRIQAVLDLFGNFLWGWPMLIVLAGTGIFFTVSLRGLQFAMLTRSLKMIFKRHDEKDEGDITHYQALMTALCATVGVGNIAGVATAVAAGGPGAVFWMWMTGLLGMATKYAEAVLGVHYRVRGKDGEMSGGPMYYITHGLGLKWLAMIFAGLLAISALGAGNMIQGNSIADSLQSSINLPPLATGVILSILVSLVIVGGVKRIAKVAEAVVPFMIVLYVGAGLLILFINWAAIPDLLGTIFHDAFTGTAAAGGFAGAIMRDVIRQGLSRGVFSNESGIGSSPIAAAAAKTKHPVEQAMVSMTQTFIDTIVVCTFTALVILSSGEWLTGATGATLTGLAFNQTFYGTIAGISIGSLIVSITLVFFAFTTILGWYYYGQKGITFLVGEKWVFPYKVFYLICVLVGAIIKLELAWNIAEICFGLMIIPNVIALWLLSGKVRKLTIDYFRNDRDKLGYQVKPFHNK